jgi:hypothetical protein
MPCQWALYCHLWLLKLMCVEGCIAPQDKYSRYVCTNPAPPATPATDIRALFISLPLPTAIRLCLLHGAGHTLASL